MSKNPDDYGGHVSRIIDKNDMIVSVYLCNHAVPCTKNLYANKVFPCSWKSVSETKEVSKT